MSRHRLIANAVAALLLPVLLLSTRLVVPAPLLPPLNSAQSGEQLDGKFVWHDLATTELEKQKTFYSDVFGWRYRTISNTDDQYTLVLNGEHSVAGMFSVTPRQDAQAGALWFGLMSANDLAKVASAVEQGGGAIHTQPTSLPQRGTYALFRDPEGALFGVLKSSSGDPPDADIEIGDFLWMDLFAHQPGQAGTFYRQLADYEITRNEVREGIERLVLNAHGRPRAGIVPLPEDANRAGWLPYVRVGDIKETLDKVATAGGYVMVPPDEDLLDGNLAIFADPQGGILGIVKWDTPAVGVE